MSSNTPEQNAPTVDYPGYRDATPVRAIVLWAGAGLFLGVVLACPCGIGVGWMAGSGRTEVKKDGVKVADGGGKPVEAGEWTWQKLQDHLKARGVRTMRGQGKKGMWFMMADSDEPLDQGDIHRFETVGLFDDDQFFVTQYASMHAASKAASSIRDEQQKGVLAWDRFVFDARPKTMARLKAALK